MKSIGIITNTEKDNELFFTKEIAEYILEIGAIPLIPTEIALNIAMDNYAVESRDVYTKSDFLVVLGGDGTILRVAKNAAINSIPILGINLGTLGYLTDCEKDTAFSSLENIIKGEFTAEKRMMLEAEIISESTSSESFLALNDICVSKGVFSTIINFDLQINDEHIDTYKADGFIVSTATGSTAYNLSAGGPIIKPNLELITLTPVCPHMMHSRSMVVSKEDTVKIALSQNATYEVILVVDGQAVQSVRPGSIVKIKSSSYSTEILKTKNKSFYDILKHKIIYNNPRI